MQVKVKFEDGRTTSVPVRLVPDRVLQGSVWKPGAVLSLDPFGIGFDVEAIEMAIGDGLVEGDDFREPEDRPNGQAFEWKLEGTPESYCLAGIRRWFAGGGLLERADDLDLDEARFEAALPTELFGVSADDLFREFCEDRKVWHFYLSDASVELGRIRGASVELFDPWLSDLTLEEVVTEDWLRGAFARGDWDPEHGSDVWRWIDALRDGDLGPSFQMPPHLNDADLTVMLDDPAFRDVVMRWMRVRFDLVLSELRAEDLSVIGRRLTCQDDWTDGLLQGDESLGVFFGTLPLDDGGFWTNQNLPVEVYMEVAVDPSVVNWPATIRARMDYVFGDEEREIRLMEDSDVKITLLEVDGEEVVEARGMTASTGTRRPRPSFSPATPF